MVKEFDDLFEVLRSKPEYNRLKRMNQSLNNDIRDERRVLESVEIWRRRVVQDVQECLRPIVLYLEKKTRGSWMS